MLRTIALTVAIASALSACSALPRTAPAPAAPPAFSARIDIQDVSGSAASGVRTPPGTAQALAEAVRTEVGRAPQGGPAARLVFVIADYRPAGRNAKTARMTVKVSITTPSGAALRQFAVTREATGGAAEARATLIAQSAEAIVRIARGEAAPT